MLRKDLTTSECIIHVDFSQNCTCKCGAEIHVVHFRAFHEQATLHTGVLYIEDVEEPATFTT